jgi:hypothetical protein
MLTIKSYSFVFFLCFVLTGCLPPLGDSVELPYRKVVIELRDSTKYQCILKMTDAEYLYFAKIQQPISRVDSLIEYSNDNKNWNSTLNSYQIMNTKGELVKNNSVGINIFTVFRTSKYNINQITDSFGRDVTKLYAINDPQSQSAFYMQRIADVQTKTYNIYVATLIVSIASSIALFLATK